jgi:hypothetical protein
MRRQNFIIDEDAPRIAKVGDYIHAGHTIHMVVSVKRLEEDIIYGVGWTTFYHESVHVMTPREVKEMLALTDGLSEGDNVIGHRKGAGQVKGVITSIFKTSSDNKVWITDERGYTVPLVDGTVEKI